MPPPLGPLWCSDPKPRLARIRLTPSMHTSTSAHASPGVRDLHVFYSKRKAAATGIVPKIAQGGALLVVGVRQWHLGQRMQSICQLGGSVGERASKAGILARPHPHACTSAHASHAERHRQQPVPGPGAHDMRVFVLAQHSATEREPESLHKAPGWGALSLGVGQQCHLV